jgi:hypothetical protein
MFLPGTAAVPGRSFAAHVASRTTAGPHRGATQGGRDGRGSQRATAPGRGSTRTAPYTAPMCTRPLRRARRRVPLRQCRRHRRAEVLTQRAQFRPGDDVHRPGDRVRGHRQPARQRLDQHHPERVRPAREHEQIRRRVHLAESFALPVAEEHRVRVLPLQFRPRRAVADDELRASRLEPQEVGNPFLVRHRARRTEGRAAGTPTPASGAGGTGSNPRPATTAGSAGGTRGRSAPLPGWVLRPSCTPTAVEPLQEAVRHGRSARGRVPSGTPGSGCGTRW